MAEHLLEEAEQVCVDEPADNGSEEGHSTMAGSELDDNEADMPDFMVPSTPPPEDELIMPAMPAYELQTTNAHPFTDGHQVFEPMISPVGQQLFTDGQQVF